MVAFGGVGRGGANMEEAGYWLHVLRGHSLSWPLPATLSLCFLTTIRWTAHFPQLWSSALPWSHELSETMCWNKCFPFPVASVMLCHIGEKCNGHSCPHMDFRGERISRSLNALYVQVGTLKVHPLHVVGNHSLPWMWHKYASLRADWSS